MSQLTNNTGISLAMAVWLAHDDYDAGDQSFPDKEVLSATALLKPTRQLVLSGRLTPEQREVDVADLISSRFGHAIHDSIEHAWSKGYAHAMRKLGYPERVIEKVRINPDVVNDGDIPVYLEQRFFREIDSNVISGKFEVNGVVISGKFDQIIDGQLCDTKTTSVYTYMNRTKEDDYRIQGSIYRWINPDKVTNDVMLIQHVFTDWQSSQAKTREDYPSSRIIEFPVELMSLKETENWILSKLREIQTNAQLPEPEIVRCTDKELWKSDPVFKYYSNPETAQNGGRATKNFPNYPAAASYRNKMGKGVVVTVPGQVKACGYCPAFPICTQKDEYNHDRS